jgi:hypothetical protein
LGEEVLILLTLLDDPNKIPLQGTVAWINPAHSAGNRPQGIGVQLQDGDAGRELRKRVEGLLAGALQSSRPRTRSSLQANRGQAPRRIGTRPREKPGPAPDARRLPLPPRFSRIA